MASGVGETANYPTQAKIGLEWATRPTDEYVKAIAELKILSADANRTR